VTAALATLALRRIVYVACDAASFARDLRVLLDGGWSLSALRAFDLFPMTEHVELMAVIDAPS
jgi:tRNA/tmRNA/rRNA uracil-C5-methylase (TrmA/RlmC/RlmD family)